MPSKWNKSTLCTGLRATSEPAALGALSVAAKPCCFSFFLVHKAFLLSLFLSAPSDASGPQGMAWAVVGSGGRQELGARGEAGG